MVIGKPGRHIPAARALDHVAAYTIFNDGSLRDYQKHSVTAGKNFPAHRAARPLAGDRGRDPRSGGADLGDPGERRAPPAYQHRRHDPGGAELIEYISAFTPLSPGDVIATGTPEGVAHARKPPLWLVPGDIVEIEISGIGILRNPVVAEPA